MRDQPSTIWKDLVIELGPHSQRFPWETVTCTRCPFLKLTHILTNWKFVNDHLEDLKEAWEKVMMSDETQIELVGINSTGCVWWKKKDEHNLKNTCERWGGKHLVFLQWIEWLHCIEERKELGVYFKILGNNLLPSVTSLKMGLP